ncbi:DUF349 domain-containing protein [Flavobacteriaceae bacterium TP-CH-4]|uniref:DUF349 domain-containing protein n=1 Tax=Pelagihabitans pacificus TaxID=2696054 RepID=A0A967AVK1_9FLAO|nr:DUF349 domain-containing protein [Pelagihabitans pacificus]NHF61191.1 DUF349 domain-containing protein [Pelagihabitans pacificus]
MPEENEQEMKEVLGADEGQEAPVKDPDTAKTAESEELATTDDAKEMPAAENKTPKEPEPTGDTEEPDTQLVEPSETVGPDTPLEGSSKTEEPATTEETKENKAVEKVEEAPASKPVKVKKSEEDEKALNEIDEENAEDAEDHENEHRHRIPILDYHAMSMENLVGELQRLVRNEKVQAIKKHVDGIKYEFDLKFQEFIDGKKEEFIANGGNEIDFRYNSVTKRQFNEVYSDYREKRNQYYKNLENTLKENLANRLEIIEELKGLVNVEEDINTTYNNFKSIQERWRNAGPVPRTHYNNVWRTYQHHIEIFYDFLHLNRELRDLDFKHNLEEKTKLVERAEALAEEKDLGKAFRELQILHKVWKEDIGPVDREHRDAIWERFSNATKVLHQRKQEHQKELEKSYEANLLRKNEIIAQISAIAANIPNNHRALQQQMKEIAALRDTFFKAGKVPQHANEATWAAFKDAVRTFNHGKNAFYKNLKKEQQQNLEKKRELLAIAEAHKDSEDWEAATQEMKRIQREWKNIGHVPRKYSDRIWKDFKDACNHYFDRLHARKNSAYKQEEENLAKKTACLERLRTFELSGEKDKDVEAVKGFIAEWKGYGRVPFKKKGIDQKFNKILDALFRKIGLDKQESELLQYGNKIQQLAKSQDQERAIGNERQFIRKKITESKNEIRQLETNLQFFSNASEDNPLVRDVIKNIDRQKAALETWKGKLKKLNIMQHRLERAEEDSETKAQASSEEE